MRAHTHTHVHMCLSMAGNLSAFLSISSARAQWDINYNMQQNHLCKSQWRGGITFLIKFPWLIVIKVSSINVSSWLSNSGPETVSTSLVIGGSDRVEGGGCVCVCVWRTYQDTNSSWAHWQPSHNWQLWNTIISVICFRIHQRLHRPVKTFTESRGETEGEREGGRDGGWHQEERRPHWLNEVFILSGRLFPLCYTTVWIFFFCCLHHMRQTRRI